MKATGLLAVMICLLASGLADRSVAAAEPDGRWRMNVGTIGGGGHCAALRFDPDVLVTQGTASGYWSHPIAGNSQWVAAVAPDGTLSGSSPGPEGAHAYFKGRLSGTAGDVAIHIAPYGCDAHWQATRR